MSDDQFEAFLGDAFAERGLTEAPTEETTSEETATETTAETPVEPAEETAPLRDEQGRFAKAEEPILGKFNSVDDLAKSYQELERAYHERNNVDVERLTREVAAMRDDQARSQYTYEDGNPQLAVEDAYARVQRSQNDPRDVYAFQSAIAEWKDADPFAAAVWYNQKQNEAHAAQLDQRLAATQPIVQRSTYEQALSSVAAKHQDFSQVAGSIPGVISEDARLARFLQSPDPEDVAWALETAYERARNRTGDNLTQATQQVQTEQAEEQRAAKAEATVASASTSGPDRGTGDAKDRLLQSILDADLGPFGA